MRIFVTDANGSNLATFWGVDHVEIAPIDTWHGANATQFLHHLIGRNEYGEFYMGSIGINQNWRVA